RHLFEKHFRASTIPIARKKSATGLVLALALFALSHELAVALPPEAVSESWIRMSSPHFVYISHVDESRTREIAHNLEALRAVLNKLGKGLELGGKLPTAVYVFRNATEFDPFCSVGDKDPGGRTVGFFFRCPDFNVIALDASSNSLGPIYHEYLHDV